MWSKSMANAWGVPDWLDAGSYPSTKNTTMREWWWEFTRRRPDYREIWKCADDSGNGYRYAPDVDEFRLRFELSVVIDPRESLPDAKLAQARYPRNYAKSPRNFTAEQAAHLRSGEMLKLAAKAGRHADEAGHFLYNFDLSRPLGPQFEGARKLLEAIQREGVGKVLQRRPRTENWPHFLRALDARDAGETFTAIRDGLWPDWSIDKDGNESKTPQSARDIYDAGCKLRDNFPL